MKKKKETKNMKITKRLSISILGVIALLVVGGLFASGIGIAALIGGAGITLATAGGAVIVDKPVEVTDSKGAGLALEDISALVTKIRPDDVPLDTLLREIGAGGKAESQEVAFYQSTTRNNQLETTSPYNTTGGYGAAIIDCNDINSVLTHDTLMCATTVAPNGKPLALHVIRKDIPGKKLHVIAINGTKDAHTLSTIVPTINAGEIIYVIGSAKNEMAAKTDAYQMLPIKEVNFVQTFMAQVTESVYNEMTKKEVNVGLVEFMADTVFDYRMKANQTAMFGAKNMLRNPEDNSIIYYMGGINDFLGLRIEYTIGSTDNTLGLTGKRLIDIGEQVFSDVNGSESRVWLCGSKAMAELMKNAEWQKQVESKNTVMKYGITFNEIETGFGKVYLKHDKSMNKCGRSCDILSIDPTKLRKRDFMPMKWRDLDLISTGDQRANAKVLEEAFTIEVRNPMCHALISGKTA